MMNSLFENPAALWALLGIAVPIWLHFYEKKSKVKRYFSDLRAFDALQSQDKGKRNWEKLLLFLLRILLLLSLILAFAKPKHTFFYPSISSSKQSVLFLDNHPAFILGNRKSFLDVGKEIPNSPNDLRFFTNNFQSTDYHTIPLDQLKNDWSQHIPSHRNQSSESILYHFDEVSDRNSVSNPMTLHWMSDFPKNKPLPKFDANHPIHLWPIPSKNLDNVVIDSVWLSDGFVKPKEKFTIKIRLKQAFNQMSTKKHQIGFYLNGFLVNNQSWNFENKWEKELSFQASLPTMGEFKAHFMIDDKVNFDNKYHFIVRTSAAQKVVFVGDQASSVLLKKVFQSETSFDFKAISKAEFLASSFKGEAFFIFQGIEKFTSTEFQSIQNQFKLGNSCVFIPESNSTTQAISFLNQMGVKARLNPTGKEFAIAQPDFTKKFFQKIMLSSALRHRVQLWKSNLVWEMYGHPDALLEFENRASFLYPWRVEKAQVFIFSSNILRRNHSFQSHGLFLPVLQELVLQHSSLRRLSIEVSDPKFSILAPPNFIFTNAEKQLVKLKNSQIELIPIQRWVGNHWECNLPSSNETGGVINGFFDVFVGKQKIGIVAFNYPKSESWLESYTAAELKDFYGKNPNVQVKDVSNIGNEFSQGAHFFDSSITLWLLAFVFFCLEFLFLVYHRYVRD